MSSAVPTRFGVNSNTAPPEFDARRDMPAQFLETYLALHREFTPRQRELKLTRRQSLARAHQGRLPDHLPPSRATDSGWRLELPSWCTDQRNQMTGPADDGELVVKMLNSGAPGVMIDLEDSMANEWSNLFLGHSNAIAALHGTLRYQDQKRGRTVGIDRSPSVIWIRVRGLHLHQAGIVPNELTSASLFDLAWLVHNVDPYQLKHPLAIYIPKSDTAAEAAWWRDAFQRIGTLKGLARDAIKCMALVESHALAYQMEEFIFNLRDHIVGLNLGRWDYMASLIHYTLPNPDWVLPDRNSIPHDVAFFQRVRELMPEICHKRGILAIGGMTALFPNRADPVMNDRALAQLALDKRNEAAALMDGAWTGHPDQNEIAVAQFPVPNQRFERRPGVEPYPDLRPLPIGIGGPTITGARTAVRVTIAYRHGVLKGKGASLIEGYMEDLATDRIYRLMLAQRLLHSQRVAVLDDRGSGSPFSRKILTDLYDEELEDLLAGEDDPRERELYIAARRESESMIVESRHDPV